MPEQIPKKRNWSLIISTALFGLCLYAWFVYLQFPYDDLVRLVAGDLKRNSSIDVRFKGIDRSFFPMNIHLSHVELTALQPGAPCALVTLPLVSVNVGIPGLLFGSVRTRFKTDAYGGIVQGTAEIDGSRDLRFSSSVEHLDLSLWEPDRTCNLLRITGTLEGEVAYACNLDRPREGSGKAEFTLSSGSIEGLKRFLIPLDRITVDRMHVQAELGKGKLRLDEFRIEAKELSATVSGEIVPAPVLGNSRLDLRVEGVVDPEVRKQHGIPFERLNLTLRGTPTRPLVRFIQ